MNIQGRKIIKKKGKIRRKLVKNLVKGLKIASFWIFGHKKNLGSAALFPMVDYCVVECDGPIFLD